MPLSLARALTRPRRFGFRALDPAPAFCAGKATAAPIKEPEPKGPGATDQSNWRMARSALNRVVHHEFDRMRGHLEASDLRHLQLDVAVDEVVVVDAARLQEGAVAVKVDQSLAQRAAHGRDLLQFTW